MGERLVLARERGRGDLRHHEARVHAAVLHKKRRKPGERAVDEERDAPPGEGADFGDGEREHVRGERDRFRVEVTAGKDLVLLREHERVVGHRGGFDLEDARGVAHLIEACAHDLWLAAQAVGILHARIVLEVRAADLAVGDEIGVEARDELLPGLPAQRMDARVERRIASAAASTERLPAATAAAKTSSAAKRPISASAVDTCVPFRSARPSFGASLSGALIASCAGMRLSFTRTSPMPRSASERWASGARSPDAPTEPFAGMHG